MDAIRVTTERADWVKLLADMLVLRESLYTAINQAEHIKSRHEGGALAAVFLHNARELVNSAFNVLYEQP